MYRLLPLLLLLIGLAACQSTENGQALVPSDDSPVIFRLGAETVTLDDYAARLERSIGPGIADLLAQGQTREQIEQLALEANVRGSVFDQMLQDALLTRYARENGIGVDPAAIDAAVFPQLDASDPLAPSAAIRQQTAETQLVFEVIARNTRADMFNARHILVTDEAAADQVMAELQAGADFAALAAERSIDPGSAARGGDLGWTTAGSFVPEFEEVAQTAPLNTPTKVESQFGWHVIEVLGREEQRAFASFEELRNNQSAQQLYEQSFLPWYDQLRREAELSGELQIAPGFDPNSVPLPFPE